MMIILQARKTVTPREYIGSPKVVELYTNLRLGHTKKISGVRLYWKLTSGVTLPNVSSGVNLESLISSMYLGIVIMLLPAFAWLKKGIP